MRIALFVLFIVARFGRSRGSFDIFSCFAPMTVTGGRDFTAVCSLDLFRERKKKLPMLKLVRSIIAGVSPNFTSCI
jgi:hypothetical protein